MVRVLATPPKFPTCIRRRPRRNWRGRAELGPAPGPPLLLQAN